MASDVLLTFDRFKIDPSSGQLVGESGPISLTPKALSLLEYLAARPGRLVMKTELLDAIWPGVFVADGALKVCIREIRRALGDDAQAPGSSRRRIGVGTASSPVSLSPCRLIMPSDRPLFRIASASCRVPFSTREAAM